MMGREREDRVDEFQMAWFSRVLWGIVETTDMLVGNFNGSE